MEVRDILHGAIEIDRPILRIVDSKAFQRLRQIRQLGFSENSFPSATHSRFIHSIGAMHLARMALHTIFESAEKNRHTQKLKLSQEDRKRFGTLTQAAALLHDIGHGPLSHTIEFAMPSSKALGIPGPERRASHEDYTLQFILNSSLTHLLNEEGKPYGWNAEHVAALIDGTRLETDGFFQCETELGSSDIRPLLSQLISSELDVDRMDYLRRDALYTGVSYGNFDSDWLIRNLTYHIQDGAVFLALDQRSLYTFEDFLLSRYHMFLMVYFHHKSIVYDEMLKKYFESAPEEYRIPADIEHYAELTDIHLFSHLAQSKNEWAKRIIDRSPYTRLTETHHFHHDADGAQWIEHVEHALNELNIPYLRAESTGDLSKYYNAQNQLPSIFVRNTNHIHPARFLPVEDCTDLFRKYEDSEKSDDFTSPKKT